jgi:hypothetical protein
MKKINKSIIIITITIIIIVLPIIIDKTIIGSRVPSNISNTEWVSFLGSYMGSIIGSIGTIAGVYLAIKLNKKKELEEINRYFDNIFSNNLREKKNIRKELLHNIIYKIKYIENINSKIYEENLLNILQLKKYEEILNIYSIQNELEKMIKNDNITGFGGHIIIKSFEGLKEILGNKEELRYIQNVLEAISVLIGTTNEKKIKNYFERKENFLEDEITSFLNKYQDPFLRLEHFINELLINEHAMIKWDEIDNNKKRECINLQGETFLSLYEIKEVSKRIKEYYSWVDKYFC